MLILFDIRLFWLTLYCLGLRKFVVIMVSRIRSALASILHYGLLLPAHAVFCVLYSAFVIPLYDYCDVVWSPTLKCLIESLFKFLNKLPLTYCSRFFLLWLNIVNITQLYNCKFSSHCIKFPLLIYITFFRFQGMWQVMLAIISILFLSLQLGISLFCFYFHLFYSLAILFKPGTHQPQAGMHLIS